MKIRIALAYDHELPLGGMLAGSTYDEAIFEPTYRLLDLSDKIDVKITLFSDILTACRFKEWDYNGFYLPYKKQLQDSIKRKHDVQLHVHPHWLTSTYSNGNYTPSADFKLADFAGSETHPIPLIIKTGKDELVAICEEARSDYKCMAYRAGGFNMQPNSKDIIEALVANGIVIDSSIAKEMYFESDFSKIDYRNYTRQSNWYLNPNGNLNDTSVKSGLFEVPVATSPSGVFYLMQHIIRKKLHKDRKSLVTGKTIHQGKTDLIKKINSLLSVKLLGFDVYTFNGKDLLAMLDWHVKNNIPDANDEIIVSTVSHPKNMGSYSLQLMSDFVDLARNKYKEKIEFCTFRDIYDTHAIK